MYEHTLREQVFALVRARVLPKAKAEKAEKVLAGYWEDKIALVWGADDVIGKAKEMGKRIGRKKAIKILKRAHDKHDASIGINWDVLECYIDDHYID